MGAPCTRAAKADTRLRHLGVAGHGADAAADRR
jgi:hypothetical protein